MTVVLYDANSLHPNDLLGILTFENVLVGTLEDYKVGSNPISGRFLVEDEAGATVEMTVRKGYIDNFMPGKVLKMTNPDVGLPITVVVFRDYSRNILSGYAGRIEVQNAVTGVLTTLVITSGGLVIRS